MQNRRQARAGPGLNIGRAAHDHPGHRQRAEHTTKHVADTLRRQLTVEVRALTIVHAVHRSSREQGLGTGDESQGKGGNQQVRVGKVEQISRPQPVDGLAQVRRHLNTVDR
ncbi:hypothetical protein D3C72_1303250 [compost metagenome]